MLDLAVFVSGGGTNLQAILDRIADGSLRDVRVACVIASRSDTHAEKRAEKAGIPCRVVRRKDFSSLAEYDPDFVDAYRGRIINVHPSLIPSFCGTGMYGLKPHEAALEYGVRITGATVHFVDEHYDEGPIIVQKAVPVLQDDTPQSLQLRVMEEAEQVILPQAIALFAAGRLKIDGRKIIIEGESK
jgi:phosphoribosylglycinamide formyltransferase-1